MWKILSTKLCIWVIRCIEINTMKYVVIKGNGVWNIFQCTWSWQTLHKMKASCIYFGVGWDTWLCFGLAVGGTLGPCRVGAPIWTSCKHSMYSACYCIRALGRQHILWFIPSIRSVHERVGFRGWGGRDGSGERAEQQFTSGAHIESSPLNIRSAFEQQGWPRNQK